MNGRRVIARAALLYFAAVFCAGFLLGAIRVTLLVPRLGTRVSELLEMPVMLAVMIASARWVVRRCHVPPSTGARLGAGCLALALMLAAEFLVAAPLRGLTPAEALAGTDPVSGTVYHALLVVYALLPLALRTVRHR